MTWTVNLKAGTVVTLSMEDANGDEAWSGDVRGETVSAWRAAADVPNPSV
jgi:hypothetical protein